MSVLPIPSLHHHRHRFLYDADFVDSGCDSSLFSEEFLEQTSVDNTIGTWLTNYVMTGVAWLAAVYFWYRHRQWQRELKESQAVDSDKFTSIGFGWMILYNLLVGITYLWAGLAHQRFDEKDQQDDYWNIVTYSVGVTTAVTLHCQATWNWIIRGLVILGAIATALSSSILMNNTFVGFYTLFVNIELVVYFAWYQRDWLASVGTGLIVLGGFIQFGFRGLCGDDAYLECFEKCPLPNPMTFNHNALFHVVYMVGLIVQAFGRYTHRQHPSETPELDYQEGTTGLTGNTKKDAQSMFPSISDRTDLENVY